MNRKSLSGKNKDYCEGYSVGFIDGIYEMEKIINEKLKTFDIVPVSPSKKKINKPHLKEK